MFGNNGNNGNKDGFGRRVLSPVGMHNSADKLIVTKEVDDFLTLCRLEDNQEAIDLGILISKCLAHGMVEQAKKYWRILQLKVSIKGARASLYQQALTGTSESWSVYSKEGRDGARENSDGKQSRV